MYRKYKSNNKSQKTSKSANKAKKAQKKGSSSEITTSNESTNEASNNNDITKQSLYNRVLREHVLVEVGDESFDCFLKILAANSDFFKSRRKDRFVVLPLDKIKPNTFQFLYDWMLHIKPVNWEVMELGELFRAANYLGMTELYKLCLARVLNSGTPLFIKSLHYELTAAEVKMLEDNFQMFLHMDTSIQAHKLSLPDIVKILDQRKFGATSELEKFMFVISWVSHDWANRELYLTALSGRVNFNELPPWLWALRGTANCPQLERALTNPIVNGKAKAARKYHISQLVPPSQLNEIINGDGDDDINTIESTTA
ncbi:kelch-like protein 6 [Teleopsis dalmanni]|uniref:kelch-like protein 6 n=1 Tax=Teleopsis dalmanni TaxID=139649 RepID=UPI0018CE25F4|nr:kelch-like protein 6 [Teleopsis dalmanni]